mmetsp:Transcript_6210/g.13702  ORF Transcript_6210/g.13702 Transcript_6210/m.13702 type:complete len:192 (+) Transcript_6210:81-656(+)
MSSEYAAFEVDGQMRDLEQRERLELRGEELRKEHMQYLDQHPELRQVLNDFMSSVLLHRPDHVFDFAKEYFSAFKQSDDGAGFPPLFEVDVLQTDSQPILRLQQPIDDSTLSSLEPLLQKFPWEKGILSLGSDAEEIEPSAAGGQTVLRWRGRTLKVQMQTEADAGSELAPVWSELVVALRPLMVRPSEGK